MVVRFLVVFLIFSLFLGNRYIDSHILVLQREGGEELTKEERPDIKSRNNFSERTAFIFSDVLAVDGRTIQDKEKGFSPEEWRDFFVVLNDDTLWASKSLINSYVPVFQRHGLIEYTVQRGDTLGKIAANFGVSLKTILWANNLNSKTLIKPGQKLVILPVSGILHKVKKGETLSYIAKKYKAAIEDILAFNNLQAGEQIRIGQKLIIPEGKIPERVSLAVLHGLKPMEDDVSTLPSYSGFYAYPTVGWNRGILHYYNAVDIINSCGTPIYAAADGMILKTGYDRWYGKYIKIQHYNGTITVYGHLSTILVKEGDIVKKKSLIGRMGDTGNARGCHLHFEVRGARNPFVLKK